MLIASDFRDYYDVWADGTGPTLVRTSRGAGPTRTEQFATLNAAGFPTPPHGQFRELIGTHWEAEDLWVERVVIYEDEAAHCGEGKRMSRRDMSEFEAAAGKFCSAYVGDCKHDAVDERIRSG